MKSTLELGWRHYHMMSPNVWYGQGKGFDAFTIASLMGHSDVTTTQRYVRATELSKRAAVQAALLGHNLVHRGRKVSGSCRCKCLTLSFRSQKDGAF
jgi:hypothetical protein